MSDGGYKALSALLILALAIDFIWVIKTALSVGTRTRRTGRAGRPRAARRRPVTVRSRPVDVQVDARRPGVSAASTD
jgi:hypothetical protein